jgi:RES domain-containing protein
MILWRLSGIQHVRAFDGGYGLLFDGRWNTAGHAVTYAATSPSLCVLEKLVHIEDPALMPAFMMVRYDVPGDLAVKTITVADLPEDWTQQDILTQSLGDAWHAAQESLMLCVPSAIVPITSSPDVNVVINHRHPDTARIRILDAEPFALDVRLT